MMNQVIKSTLEIANRYCELARQNKWPEILDELCSQDMVNQEPEHAVTRGIQPITVGMDAIKAKGEANRKMIEEIHSQACSEPLVAGNFFALTLTRDITFKGRPRVTLEEIGVFGLEDGRIISEQFFY
jgi:hypothetical protein